MFAVSVLARCAAMMCRERPSAASGWECERSERDRLPAELAVQRDRHSQKLPLLKNHMCQILRGVNNALARQQLCFSRVLSDVSVVLTNARENAKVALSQMDERFAVQQRCGALIMVLRIGYAGCRRVGFVSQEQNQPGCGDAVRNKPATTLGEAADPKWVFRRQDTAVPSSNRPSLPQPKPPIRARGGAGRISSATPAGLWIQRFKATMSGEQLPSPAVP
jgi:hypothetical protein